MPRGLSSVRIRDVAALFNGSKHRDDGFKCMSFYYDRRNQEFIATKNENNVMIKFPLSVNSSVNDQNLRVIIDEMPVNPLLMNHPFQIVEVYGKKFYINLLYLLPPRSSFVVSVFLAENQEVAEKYYVNINISTDTLKYQRKVLGYKCPVLSIDNISSVTHEETIDQSWCIHFEAVRPFFDEARNCNLYYRMNLPMRVNVGKV